MRETVGANIKARRLALGWTMADLAERMFGNPKRESYISAIENGKHAIDVERLAAFAAALYCQPSDLLLTITRDEERK